MTICGSLAMLVCESPGMLGLAVLAVLPWVIAWRAMPKTRRVPFAAMPLVKAAVHRQGIWRSLRAWLLPLVRTWLVTAVVLAAAGLRWQPLRTPLAHEEERTAVVFDDSPAAEASRSVLAAVESLGEFSKGAWRIERITVADAPLESLPAETALVIVADGFVPSADLGRWIADRVAAGGGLLVLVGPRATSPERQEALSSWLDRLCGIRITGRTEGSWGIAARPADDRLPWEPLAGPTVRTHATLSVRPDRPPGVAGLRPGRTVVLQQTQGSQTPLVLRRQLGNGWALLAATPWSLAVDSHGEAWSDLPAWPVFLEVVGEVTRELAAKPPAWASPAFGTSWLGGWLQRWLPWDRAGGVTLAGASLLLALLMAGIDPLLTMQHNVGKAGR